ncbi:MAG: alpha/beta hydrolase [Alphaproteobacteria bacterium]
MNFVGTTVGVYLLLNAAVFVMQRSLLYPAARQAPNLAAHDVTGLSEVVTQTPDGLTLRHWYVPPSEAGAAVLVVFHGNAGHLGDRVPKLDEIIEAGFGVLFAGYRGYSGNPGKPTEDNLTADARLLLDWLVAQGVPPDRTVLYGESLGTGVAVKMAAEREFAAVILESPYTSIAEVAQTHYWYLPAKWLVLDKWDSMAHIGRLRAPLLVVHGARDKTVPTRYGRRLFAAAPEPKELLILEGAAHNDLYEYPQVAERVIAFLRRHAAAGD